MTGYAAVTGKMSKAEWNGFPCALARKKSRKPRLPSLCLLYTSTEADCLALCYAVFTLSCTGAAAVFQNRPAHSLFQLDGQPFGENKAHGKACAVHGDGRGHGAVVPEHYFQPVIDIGEGEAFLFFIRIDVSLSLIHIL